uniref:Uncharacterized protein n=1 Tax=Noctiluca scintillans TaxID=2966 RepID=A0A7S1FKV0_NOCSC|mmetsp:Transcript_9175/g.25640  ORF Transcript_9175/g.25640 Transcript_9175/m.25640 type:complete len:400 (+) Transcript_9175:44-1243(+)
MYNHGRGRFPRGGSGNTLNCPGCGFCQGFDAEQGSHARGDCSKFKTVKRNTTRNNYLEVSLQPSEETGFAAAGVMLFKRIAGDVEFLMAREFRNCHDKLNFLGGKRNLLQAHPLSVAVDKLDSETGRALHRTTLHQVRTPGGCPLVLWSPESKYVLYLFELSADSPDAEIDVQAAGTFGAKRLEWVRRADLQNERFLRVELHDFSVMMLRDIAACGVLAQLEELFDAASIKLGGISPVVTPVEGLTEPLPESAQHFDVVAALGIAAGAARPGAPGLPPKPSWSQLIAVKGQLHSQDIKKLRLRFHPDRLPRFLDRDPSPAEQEMSTKAMQILNLLFGDTPERDAESGKTTIAELATLINRARQGATVAGVSQADNVTGLEDLLASIKLSSSAQSRNGCA